MDIIKLNNDIKIRNQFVFDAKNVLLTEVKTAYNYNDAQAKTSIASICKEITFCIEAMNKNFISNDVVGFLKKCKDNGWVNPENSYLNETLGFYDGVFKKSFAEKFGINAIGHNSYDAFIKWSNIQIEFIGTLRIVNAKGDGKHSLICYKQNNKLFISDTSSRGIGVDFYKYINKTNFVYFTSLFV